MTDINESYTKHHHGFHPGKFDYGYGPGGPQWYKWPVYPPYYEPVYVGKTPPQNTPQRPIEEDDSKIIRIQPELCNIQSSQQLASHTYYIIGMCFILVLVLILFFIVK